MSSASFEALLFQADEQARNGRWQDTLDTLTRAVRLRPDHAGTLTGLGTCLIQLNRPQDALPLFEQAAGLAPDSPEAHNNLGVAYACAGEPGRAEAAYQRALACDSGHVPAWKNLALLQIQQSRFAEGVPILAALVRSNPADLEAVIALAECYQQGGETESALTLYRQALKLQPEHAVARAAVARLAPPPAPSTARRVARPEHTQKLAALKSLKKANGAAGVRAAPAAEVPSPAPKPSVGFFGAAGWWNTRRVWAPARWLAAQGHRVKVAPLLEAGDLEALDLIVIARPHAAPSLGEAVARARQAGKRVVVDLDEDFHRLPPGHPDHAKLGPGNPDGLRVLEASLAQADRVTVATEALADRYAAFARQIEVAPDTWDADNPLWQKPGPARSTVNLGWVGTEAEIEDLAWIKNDLVRVLRQSPLAQLVIAGAPGAYQLFDAVPEKQCLYLPPLLPEDYPYLLAHFDVLLVPLRDTDYNRSRSARRLMEAGARGLPWVASPLPAHQAWAAGGLFAVKPGDWPAAIQKLIDAPGLRQEMGAAGRAMAGQHQNLSASGGPKMIWAVLGGADGSRQDKRL